MLRCTLSLLRKRSKKSRQRLKVSAPKQTSTPTPTPTPNATPTPTSSQNPSPPSSERSSRRDNRSSGTTTASRSSRLSSDGKGKTTVEIGSDHITHFSETALERVRQLPPLSKPPVSGAIEHATVLILNMIARDEVGMDSLMEEVADVVMTPPAHIDPVLTGNRGIVPVLVCGAAWSGARAWQSHNPVRVPGTHMYGLLHLVQELMQQRCVEEKLDIPLRVVVATDTSLLHKSMFLNVGGQSAADCSGPGEWFKNGQMAAVQSFNYPLVAGAPHSVRKATAWMLADFLHEVPVAFV